MKQYDWFSTEPNPRTSGMNAAGGWKLHAVEVVGDGIYGDAICGCRPAHGWGCDLFITDKCRRCATKVKG